MKNSTIILAVTGSLSFLVACTGGDHEAKAGDTSSQGNQYKVAKNTSKIDTIKTTSADHSASGGTDLMKDTNKQSAKK